MAERDGKQLDSDEDLESRSALTNFNISRIFKYFVLGLCIALISLLAYTFVEAVITDKSFGDSVNNELKDNIVGIVITALAVIGINLGVLRK